MGYHLSPCTFGVIMDSFFKHRWHEVWALQELPTPVALGQRLIRAWGEPHRHYHTLDHLKECLDLLDGSAWMAHRPFEIELALWFHDVIYDTHRSDNEALSSDYAGKALTEVGISAQTIASIQGMILATGAHAQARSFDAGLMLDIDLGILSASPVRFAQYEKQIRSEYDWVPWAHYREGRLAVLRSFHNRNQVYFTAAFQRERQTLARENLDLALANLTLRQALLPFQVDKMCQNRAPSSTA
jgi:predicted metal-dependent HD superfamily phosphohydrolase